MATYTKTSNVSGITRTMEFPQYTQDEFEKRFIAWNNGNLLLQEAFAEISPNGREFILSGMTGDEWDEYFAGGGKAVYRRNSAGVDSGL